jgi:SAM-dependent methyltransferase
MREHLLPYLACPACQAILALVVLRREAEQIMAGELRCGGCCRAFPIVDGVPRLLLADRLDPVQTRVAARFAEEWTRFEELNHRYRQQLLDWLAPLTPADFAGRTVYEAGCGKGRHTALCAGFGARDVVAVDLGDSAWVAFRNTRHLPNAHVIQADLVCPPLRGGFDLAFSVGVLHHLTHPEPGFRALLRQLRPGGRLAIWVYGREGNEWIVRFVDPLRLRLTARMPAQALFALSALPTAALQAALRILYRRRGPVRRLLGQGHLPYEAYLTYISEFSFHELHSIVFDQLVTPVAHYFPEHEVRRWLAEAGLLEVRISRHNDNSWRATGRLPELPGAEALAAGEDAPSGRAENERREERAQR